MRRWLAAAVAVLGLGGAYLLSSQWTALITQTSPEIAYALAGLLFVIFWVLFLAALSPPPREDQLRMRRRVFYLNGVLLPLLFAVALLYYTHPFANDVPWLKTALHGIWFGVLGSVAISFKGVSDHPKAAEWDEGWWVWYLQRPFMGAVVGVMTYTILQVANPQNPPSIAALAVAAFIFGTQEQRFFNLLYEIAKLVLGAPGEVGLLTILNVALAGGTLVVTGRGFKPGARLIVNNQELQGVTVAPGGTSITAPYPAPAPASFDVVVLNPDGAAAWVSQASAAGAGNATDTTQPVDTGPANA
jgi:hypothetical protein